MMLSVLFLIFLSQLPLCVVPILRWLIMPGGGRLATAAPVSPEGKSDHSKGFIVCVSLSLALLLFLIGSEPIAVARGICGCHWPGLSHVPHP